jgi:hypothetical protein
MLVNILELQARNDRSSYSVRITNTNKDRWVFKEVPNRVFTNTATVSKGGINPQ